ncbi:MAG TPA: hypothetical protein VFL82_02685, partial [Thermomicrobiales bacterium]|nr:hypothetical protein [Thermomicrobiales bacterium]
MRRTLEQMRRVGRMIRRPAAIHAPLSTPGSLLGAARIGPWRTTRLWHAFWVVPILLVLALTASRALADRQGASTPVIKEFSILPLVADPGGQVTLTWNVERAESVSISPGPGKVALAGSLKVTAGSAPSAYRLTAVNGTQRVTRSVQLDIAPQPPAIGYFSASSSTIPPGQSVVLNWAVVGDHASVKIDPGDGSNLAPVGSVMLQPSSSTVYTLTATNPAGKAVQTLQITVGKQTLAAPPQITKFSATPAHIDLSAPGAKPPETATLSWTVTGATSVELVGPETKSGLAADGTLDVAVPTQTTTYSLIASNSGGTATKQVTIDVIPPAGTAKQTPVVVVIPAGGQTNAAAISAPPNGAASGNTNEGVGAASDVGVTTPLPTVDLLTASPNPARVGDEVIVRWAVSGAQAVSVETVPAPPDTTPLVANAGVFRFIAKENVAVLLEATSSAGATVRQQVGVRVLEAAAPVAADVRGTGVPLIAAGGIAGSAMVNDDGDVWLFRPAVGSWTLAGTLGLKPVSVAIAGTTIFGLDSDGQLRALDLSHLPANAPVAGTPGATPSAAVAATPTALKLGQPVKLTSACAQPVALAGHERPSGASDEVVSTLLVACAKPSPVVLALAVNDGKLGSPRWTSKLAEAPAALTMGAIDGEEIAVRYPLYSPRAAKIDLIDTASGKASEVVFPGKVAAAVPSPDGGELVAALFDDAALYVVEQSGAAPRRMSMPGEVRTLAWASSAHDVSPQAEADLGLPQQPVTDGTGGTDAFG